MNREKWARILNGREYGGEITREEIELAKRDGVVIVYGASDDLCEINGAIDEEIGCYFGGSAFFGARDVLRNECDDDDCPYFKKDREKSVEMKISKNGGYWEYDIDLPVSRFKIVEGDDLYCIGIVFSLDDLKVAWEKKQKAGVQP